MQPVLMTQGLNVFSKETGNRLVENVDLTLERGRTLCIVGESGSGKTLTAMSVAGLLPGSVEAQGSIWLDGQELSAEPGIRQRTLRTGAIGIVFQNPSTALNPRMTIGAQMLEALRPEMRRDSARAAQICHDLLVDIGVANPMDKLIAYPHELSGGIAQRIVIAMALARQPKVLIADEPTTALDATIQAQILDLIDALQEKHNFGVLLITHDMGVVRDRADDVLVMAAGRVVERGAAEALFRGAKSAVARKLLRASELIFSEASPSPASAAPLLAVRDVSKVFAGGVHALRGISFIVGAGQSVGIVGESGSGKTTIARIIAGLQTVSSGAVQLEGRDRGPRERSPFVQYVFQDPYSSLDPRMPIVDIVAEPLRALGQPKVEARERAEALLEEVGLDPASWKRTPISLSGGQRQRVGIARAVAPDPRLLISDEPVAALDITVRDHILELLQAMQARRAMAHLLISHDLVTVARLCTEVIVMRGGQIVEHGAVRDIFERPQHPYTQQLLLAIPGRRHRQDGIGLDAISTMSQ